MSSKKRLFYLYSAVVSFVVISTSLISNHYLTILLDNYLQIGIFVTIVGVLMHLALSKTLIKTIFQSEENFNKKIKKTLHELNIPASTIKINTQMLQKNLKDEKSINRLERINKATNQLLEMYNKLEYEIKKQIDKIEKKEFDLQEVVENSISKFDDIKKDINIVIEIENKTLFSDKDGFELILDNLFSNAIKYNKPNGFINISYKDGYLKIFNSGKSIDTKNIFLVFEQYYQENNQNSGVGLGLFLVKEYCDKNSIEIKIEPCKDGTTFILNLEKLIV